MARAPRAATSPPTPKECARVDLAMQSRVRARLLKAYSPSYKGCTLDVGFAGCAPAGAISSMTIESGYGHSWGTTIVVTSLVRADDGGWNVTRLELLAGKGSGGKWQGEATDGVRVLRGRVSSTALEAAMEQARALASVTPMEREPPGLGGGGWMSSCDLHKSLDFTAGGATFADEYTGYASNDAQLRSLPLELAVEAVDAQVPKKALVETTLDPAARTLFVERMLEGAAAFDEDFHWWVREDFLSAAGDAGDARVLPMLVRYLGNKPPADDASGNRSRVQAINAVAALTHDDRRFDAKGKERTVDDVAADYLSKPPKS